MLTLTKASEETKEILKWGGLFLAGLFIILVFLRIVFYIKDAFFPTPPPKPTVAFGKLPFQNFPKNVTDKKLTFALNTLTGDTPNLQDQAKVYQIEQLQSDLLALSRTQDMVTPIGFTSKPTEISNRTFEWSTSDNRSIQIDIINHNFVFSYPYLSDPNVLSSAGLSTTQAISVAKNMLGSMQLLSDDIDLTKTKAISYSISNNQLVPATSLSNTQIVRVAFVQADTDGLPIYYDDPNSSSMNFLVSGGNVVAGSFLHQKIIPVGFATYPLKTSKTAYEELQKGKGYIASYYGSSGNIVIREVFLAYYISAGLQNYLMPVFVFQGDDGFYAYISAVTDEWIGK